MACNTFLQVTLTSGDVEGESQVGGFEKHIECTGWTWSVTHTGSAGSGPGGSSGAAMVADLVVTAPIDKSFPILSQAAGKGTQVKTAVLTVCKLSGDNLLKYHTVTMTGGILAGVTVVGSTDNNNTSTQTMTISFNFSAIQFEYVPQQNDGSGGGSTTGTVQIS